MIDPIRGNTKGSILVILYAAFASETEIIVFAACSTFNFDTWV